MDSPEKKSIVRRFGLMIWAWATLILCFVLVLLVNQMLSEGRVPLDALETDTDAMPETAEHVQTSQESYGTREVSIFFAAEQGHVLATESSVIEYTPRTVENCRRALQQIIAGPKQEFLLPLLPEQTRIRGLYLKQDGELVVDLSTEMLLAHHRPRSAEMEALMAFGIVNTMMQPQLQGEDGMTVKQVRFLFDGAVPQELFPAHIDLGDPLVQDKRWVQAG